MNSYQQKQPSSSRRRSLRRLLTSALAALALVPVTVLAAVAPASADTSDFRGVNWARMGDNFTTGNLVLDGLSSSDSYETVRAKADAIYSDMSSLLGINTVRLPINTPTVNSSWWNAYRGTIDAATARGFKVIVTYWGEDGVATDGRITDPDAFNATWDTVIAQYGSNSQVYFEPMNEPWSYSASEWLNVAAAWIDARPSIPKGRILVSGTGINADLRPPCNDSRFDGTLLSLHHYTFMSSSPKDYAGWRSDFEWRLGSCASRAVVTEFGAPQDTGLDYNDPGATDNFVRYIRAVTDGMRDHDIGGTYWPALGGKVTEGQDYDWYSMFALHGSGTDLSLSVRNQSGADRLLHAWGDGPGAQTADIVSRHSGRCLDVVGASSANNAEVIQYTCSGGANQQWYLHDTGGGYYEIIAQHSGKCLDVANASTDNSAQVRQYDCGGGTNQQWQLREADGGFVEIVARHSGKCLDVIGQSTENGARLQQFDCWGGANQQWSV